SYFVFYYFFMQADDGIRVFHVTGVQTCALPISKQSSVRISDQHRSIDLVATAVNEMGATVHEVATHAASTAQETRQAEASAAEGSRVLERTVTAIRDLAGEVKGTSGVIGELERETGRIITILNEIKGIAEQTNLLALKAAIERSEER